LLTAPLLSFLFLNIMAATTVTKLLFGGLLVASPLVSGVPFSSVFNRRQASCVGGIADGICQAAETHASCPPDCLIATCGDAVCLASAGEDTTTCPFDCAPPTSGKCGDSVCTSDENEQTCPLDCVCGNGKCQGTETALTCPQDCKCGDGVCDNSIDETSFTCPSDCPSDSGANTPNPLNSPNTPIASDTVNTPLTGSNIDNPSNQLGDSPPANAGQPSGAATNNELKSTCNGDGYCDANNGENLSNCPNDCTEKNTSSVELPQTNNCNNNGICEADENNGNCPNDCALSALETPSENVMENISDYETKNPGAVLAMGHVIKPGGRLNASCGTYLELERTGNIVIKDQYNALIWQSDSSGMCGNKGCSLAMGNDGVLQLQLKLGPKVKTIWYLSNKACTRAVLLANGNFVCMDATNRVMYQTGAVGVAPAQCTSANATESTDTKATTDPAQ